MKKRPLTVSIPANCHDLLESMSVEEDISKSALVTRALESFFEYTQKRGGLSVVKRDLEGVRAIEEAYALPTRT